MTDPATAEDRIAEIRARLDAATEGHWYPISIEFRGQVSHSVKSSAGSVLAHTGYGPKGGSSHANAEFMAHARQDVEALLSELEAARTENAELRNGLGLAEASNPHVFRLWEELGTGLMEVECEAPNCDWKVTFNPPISAAMKAQALRFQKEHRQASELEAARASTDRGRQADDAPDEITQLKTELEAAQARLDAHRALHKPERRYTPDDGITSYDTAEEAAGAEDIPIDAVAYFEVCSHCASIEQGEHGGHDYRESLWPCADARALGLGEEDTE